MIDPALWIARLSDPAIPGIARVAGLADLAVTGVEVAAGNVSRIPAIWAAELSGMAENNRLSTGVSQLVEVQVEITYCIPTAGADPAEVRMRAARLAVLERLLGWQPADAIRPATYIGYTRGSIDPLATWHRETYSTFATIRAVPGA